MDFFVFPSGFVGLMFFSYGSLKNPVFLLTPALMRTNFMKKCYQSVFFFCLSHACFKFVGLCISHLHPSGSGGLTVLLFRISWLNKYISFIFLLFFFFLHEHSIGSYAHTVLANRFFSEVVIALTC